MTNRQTLEIRASEIRQRLNEIAGLEGDALTDEIRAESDALTVEYRDTETKLRAAIAADPGPAVETRDAHMDAEARARIELRGRATLGAFVLAALQGREVAGAELEYRQSLGFHGGDPARSVGVGPAGPARRGAGSDPGAGDRDRRIGRSGAAVRVRTVDCAAARDRHAVGRFRRILGNDREHCAPGVAQGEGRQRRRHGRRAVRSDGDPAAHLGAHDRYRRGRGRHRAGQLRVGAPSERLDGAERRVRQPVHQRQRQRRRTSTGSSTS